MKTMKKCKICGCRLDPGEWCNCQDEEATEVDREEARIPVRGSHNSYAQLQREYIERCWDEFYMR